MYSINVNNSQVKPRVGWLVIDLVGKFFNLEVISHYKEEEGG